MTFAHEIYIAVAALILFFTTLTDLGKGKPRLIALALAAGAVASSVVCFGAVGEPWGGIYRVDGFSQVFKFLISLGFFLVVAFGEGLRGVDEEHEAEYLLFLAISVLGLTFLVSSVELLTLYIALELSSYSLYIMVPLRRREQAKHIEAGIKYVLFGAVASGVSLFGMSYVFGLAHTTRIDELVNVFPALVTSPMGLIALSMMFAGFFFKLAMVPFHLWTPDIYEGAANETSGVIATLPKIGAVAVLIRLTGLAEVDSTFTMLLVLLAILSMTYGNLAALMQEDLKRLLAFSSISHAGYMMAGILTGTIGGFASAIYYVGGYLLMNLALFHVIYALAPKGDNVVLDDLKGLSRRSPILALTLAVGAFGLAGIPPAVGFWGKFFVLTSAWSEGFTWLVIVGALNTAISIFYYLKMVRAAYTAEEAPSEAVEGAPSEFPTSATAKLLGVAFCLSILTLGAFPDAVMEIFRSALHWVQ